MGADARVRPYARSSAERHRFASARSLRLPSPQRRSRVLESLLGVDADGAAPVETRVQTRVQPREAGFRHPSSDEARGPFLANTKERREMRTDHRTHDVTALRRALARKTAGPAGERRPEARRARGALPPLPPAPALARRRRVPALRRARPAALARVARQVALLLVPLPVQRHRRHALPQLAPAALEVVRLRRS